MPTFRPVPAPRWLLPALTILLFGSGVCALVYQVLWLRLLALTFGVTVHAAATVLSSFMGGLALGSMLAGRLADRSAVPLRLFGQVELLIGICALATPTALGILQTGMAAAAPHLPDSLAFTSVVRLILSFLVLLVPTALMGATLPIVVKSSLTRREGLGTSISLLYAFNTAGAIVGAGLAGFVLLPQIGMTRSFLLASGVNVLVGLLAIVLARAVRRSDPGPPLPAPRAAPDAVGPAPARWTAVLLLVSAMSGFASLALEVIWFRLLGIFVGPTSYTFTVVLAMVLAGIAIGSFLAAALLRWRSLDHLQGLALLQIAGGALVLRSFAGLLVPRPAPHWLQDLMGAADLGFAVPAVAMGLTVVLPASIFFGIAFPVGLKVWTEARQASGLGRGVGIFYSINVTGGILGSLAAGFLLLPLLGSRTSLIAMAGLYLVAGIVLQSLCARRRPLVTGLAVSAIAAVVMQASVVPDPMDVMHRRIYTGRPVIWEQEGTQTTVAVAGAVNDRVMFMDGRHQANDSPGMVFVHRRIGLLPAVLHVSPRRALVIGLGGGATPGGLSQFPGLDIDVVELSSGVVEGAAHFSHMNFDVLGHPRVHIRVDDGRNFLQRVRIPYDVITADAIIPRHAGANSLNSVEYFRLVRAALAPDGVALHWNGGATHAEHRLILRAFVDAFPHATLWGDGSLMIGTKEPLTVSRARIEGMLNDPSSRQALALMNIASLDHMLRIFKAGPRAIATYLEGSATLSDDRPQLEYYESLPQEPLRLLDVSGTPDEVFVP